MLTPEQVQFFQDNGYLLVEGLLTKEEAARYRQECHELAERIRPQECSVPAGGLLVMRPLLVHASSKALSESPRRVLHIEYAASKRLPDGMGLPD